MTAQERIDQLKTILLPKLDEQFGAGTYSVQEHRAELSITVPPSDILSVAGVLKNDPALRFDMLKDVHVVDWNRRKARFEVIYNFWSLDFNFRLRVKSFVEEKNPHIESLANMYGSANWYEREAYDMHGVIFDGHPDLRRMYMPEDFVDPESGEPLYPLRKEFPLMGIPGSMPLPQRER